MFVHVLVCQQINSNSPNTHKHTPHPCNSCSNIHVILEALSTMPKHNWPLKFFYQFEGSVAWSRMARFLVSGTAGRSALRHRLVAHVLYVEECVWGIYLWPKDVTVPCDNHLTIQRYHLDDHRYKSALSDLPQRNWPKTKSKTYTEVNKSNCFSSASTTPKTHSWK